MFWKTLADVVLEHATLTIFCNIPLNSLRENSIEELNLYFKGIGVPGAIVLSKLLLSNHSLKSAKCADHSCPHCSTMYCERFTPLRPIDAYQRYESTCICSLSFNSIRAEGAKFLSDGLKENKGLTALECAAIQ